MRLSSLRTVRAMLAGLAWFCLAGQTASTAPAPAPPNPVLYLSSVEYFENGGTSFTRYRFNVQNAADYPAEMFAPAPNLPPCGKNAGSSRTWVDIFDQRGTRLYGFCALSKPADLNGIWFALDSRVVPPSWVYVELNDRATNTRYKSNLAETTF